MRMMMLAALATALAATPLPAQTFGPQAESTTPALPSILSLREQAKVRDAWLAERLDTVVPKLMRERGVDMWVLIAREYAEDPVVETMLDAQSMRARRRTILIFDDPGDGQPVKRYTVSRYGLAGLFDPAWNPEAQPDQWQRVGELVAARNPRRIAVNVSSGTALADGLTQSQYQDFRAALAPRFRDRIVDAEALAINWLEVRTPAEMARYGEIVRIAHAILAEGLSAKVIRPGITTTADVMWWYRERIAGLKLQTWFQPSVNVYRRGSEGPLMGDTVIQRGDMLWTDFGITYLGLNTDTQHLGYVLRRGERDAPAGLRAGLAAANAVQDTVTNAFAVGRSGNDVLVAARKASIDRGLVPTIYSHPIGYHGHGAGSAIGFWDDQAPGPRGTFPIRADTAWSIELAAEHAVPEWGGQKVSFKLEEDAYFDGRTVRYIDGRQTRFHLIR